MSENKEYYISIDRSEGDFAVCVGDDGKSYSLPLQLLPQGARVGEALLLRSDGVLCTAAEETARRKQKIVDLQNELFE
ncbi:MAG: DUF3006 domain-containing protein [Hydrogenoanaerobacterium sp.]